MEYLSAGRNIRIAVAGDPVILRNSLCRLISGHLLRHSVLQLHKNYGREQADVIINIACNR